MNNDEKGSPCPLCKEQHPLRACPRFKGCSVEQRREQVRKRKACFNCLGQGHTTGACPSLFRCRQCNERHHTLLHLTGNNTTSPAETPRAAAESTAHSERPSFSEETGQVAALSSSTSGTVLLATALVRLIGESGRALTVRALLDSGLEASFVSERVAQQLRLPRRRVNVTVSGLQGVTTGMATHAVTLMVGADRSPSLRITIPRALVLSRLTALTPGGRVARHDWPHLEGLKLADPAFDRPAAVDAVLGADVYGMLLNGDVKRGPPGQPTAHSTVFGWVLMGPLTRAADSNSIAAHHSILQPDLQEDLRRFWELEGVSAEPIQTPEESYCERLFAETHLRDEGGRYVVRLPRRENPPTGLGASRRGVQQMLLSTERRLERMPALKSKYTEFMCSYLSLGHMELVPSGEKEACSSYYMLHHTVVKPTDPDGKIRVVFNASFRTTTGVSLNDVLLSGPKLQADLWLVLTRWRMHQYAFTTDIVKMFRQIRVYRDDTDLQRILWRADLAAEIQEFRLTTVTYGTASAPYFAIRTLLQLARDEESRFSQGAKAIRSNTYVDDILAGASSLEDALEVKHQVVSLLRVSGFELSKWAGSHAALCPEGDKAERLFLKTDTVGTFGVYWAPTTDRLTLRAIPTLQSIGALDQMALIQRAYSSSSESRTGEAGVNSTTGAV
ncbi:uncharacterized protein LOC114942105 [Nylanderia fulva]|uniref:uncharacterized protein LOC114942105 n=1 Tax=Nylanderia fulva TaxID=613905 RepID=UPI0010FAF1C1|nr:uncharacterized protein LOC114942105 [Nylanderia fulva]